MSTLVLVCALEPREVLHGFRIFTYAFLSSTPFLNETSDPNETSDLEIGWAVAVLICGFFQSSHIATACYFYASLKILLYFFTIGCSFLKGLINAMFCKCLLIFLGFFAAVINAFLDYISFCSSKLFENFLGTRAGSWECILFKGVGTSVGFKKKYLCVSQ